MTNSFNPEHPTSKALHDNWHKVAAIIMHKMGITETVITQEDLRAFQAQPNMHILADGQDDGIKVSLVTEAEARRIASEAGGVSKTQHNKQKAPLKLRDGQTRSLSYASVKPLPVAEERMIIRKLFSTDETIEDKVSFDIKY